MKDKLLWRAIFVASLALPFTVEADSHLTAAPGSDFSVTSSELVQGIKEKTASVEEFNFIREQARKMGVKVYLFGGTAAGFAHYVKWDIQKQKGDPRFQPDRFDYDFTNIYRSTQDLDIVVDGTLAQIDGLQALLAKRFPYLQGSKNAWEVRSLRESRGKPGDRGFKEALLGSYDFNHQHTDSNSVGLIEITESDALRPVRDLRDVNGPAPQFLQDLIKSQIHYYYSPLHWTTSRARNGQNPQIIGIIRLLTKAFQYELAIDEAQWQLIKRIVRKFDPERDLENSVARDWVIRNGPKLFQHAVNIEYAWETLQKLGLRKKLMRLDDVNGKGSLAWWMNKEPLRSFELGGGFSGKTAGELGIDVVAHETSDMLTLESITRAHTGDPNVLASRPGQPNESAIHGTGFYARVGREGAAGTGLTIRFHLNPRARLGHDFEMSGDYIIVKNKRALRVIPENLRLTPLNFFELLQKGSFGDASDRGILEKARRLIRNKSYNLDVETEAKIVEIVREELSKSEPSSILLREFLQLPIASRHAFLFENPLQMKIYSAKSPEDLGTLLDELVEKPDYLPLALKVLSGFNRAIYESNHLFGFISDDLIKNTAAYNKILNYLVEKDDKDGLIIALKGHSDWHRSYDEKVISQRELIQNAISPETRRNMTLRLVQWCMESCTQNITQPILDALYPESEPDGLPLQAAGRRHMDELLDLLSSPAMPEGFLKGFNVVLGGLIYKPELLNGAEKTKALQKFKEKVLTSTGTSAWLLLNFLMRSDWKEIEPEYIDVLLSHLSPDRRSIHSHSDIRLEGIVLLTYLSEAVKARRLDRVHLMLDRANDDLLRAALRHFTTRAKEFDGKSFSPILAWFSKQSIYAGTVGDLFRLVAYKMPDFFTVGGNDSYFKYFVENIHFGELEIMARFMARPEIIKLPGIPAAVEVLLIRRKELSSSIRELPILEKRLRERQHQEPVDREPRCSQISSF